MKKLFLAACMMFGGVAFVNAQDTTSTAAPTDPTATTTQSSTSSSSTAMTQEDGRVKIKSQDLPDAVKKSLESADNRGWLVSAAYKVDGASSTSSDASSSDAANSASGSSSSSGASSPSSAGNGSVNATSGAYSQEIYIVELKNGAQTKTVRFDKDGNKLDDMGMKSEQK